jgi:hypothetical protein
VQLIFEARGRPSSKWVRKGLFKDEYFSEDFKFKFEEVDKVTKNVRAGL